jgi:hypothetical protein
MTSILATIAVLLVACAAFSRRLQLLSVSGAIFFTTAGLHAGPGWVYVRGLTANPLTERYVRWWTPHPRDALLAMESVPAGEQRAGPGG